MINPCCCFRDEKRPQNFGQKFLLQREKKWSRLIVVVVAVVDAFVIVAAVAVAVVAVGRVVVAAMAKADI